MAKRISFVLIGVALLTSILACNTLFGGNIGRETINGSGTVIEVTRLLDDLTSVELAMPGTLYIETGNRVELRIEAEDNLMEHIFSDVTAGKLVIRTAPGINLRHTRPINYYLTVVELDRVAITSSGDINTGDLAADSFEIASSSSGNLTLGNLACDSLQVGISSSGDVLISSLIAESVRVNISSSGSLGIQSGLVESQDIRISSSGEYRAEALESSKADVTLSSSGSATIRVSESLSGSLSSSGNIYYLGDPGVDVSTSSSGKAVKIEE